MSRSSWQLQDAKNRFSELVNDARKAGPQIVTRRGQEVVVVLSMEDYEALTRPKQSLVDFLRASPLADVDLEIERDKSRNREVEL